MTPTMRSRTPQYSGALPTGTRVEKINSNHRDSRAGTVTSSLRPEMYHGQMTHAYLVVWDDCKVPVFVVGSTIRKVVKR
jgi:hypothetical protein